MTSVRCQINTSIDRSLKMRVEELQEKKITVAAIIEAGVMALEKKLGKRKQKSPSVLS